MASSFRKIIFLTGAGISAESGLETFRDAHGLWNKYNTDDVASLNGFINNPKLVHQFYNELRMQMAMAQPNDAHLALSYLQHFLLRTFILLRKILILFMKKPLAKIFGICMDKLIS